jgi:putative oxidoreductase
MKIASLVARILLGLMFTVFGLNGFLHFIPMGPMPTGTAGQFAGALAASHYMVVVSGLQVGTGVLLLLNQFVPLALTLLGPVIVNIVLFHALMAPSGLGLAAVVTVLWFLAAYRVRSVFIALLQRQLAE